MGLDPLTQPVIDACTLNNALNVAQLVVLVVLVQWLRRDPPRATRRLSDDDR